MTRFRNLWLTAGPVGAGLLFAAMAYMLYVTGIAVANSDWMSPTLAVLPCFGLAYLTRNALVANFAAAGKVMGVLWIAFIAAAVFRPAAGWFPGEGWVFFPFVGLYLGAYFWMLSDPALVQVMVMRRMRR